MLVADIVSASGTSWDEVMADFQLHSMNFAQCGEGGQARCPAEERDRKIERARDAAASKRSTAVAAGGRVEQEDGSRSDRQRGGTPESYPERVKKLEALVSVLSVFQPLSHQLQNCRADSVPLSSLSFLLSSSPLRRAPRHLHLRLPLSTLFPCRVTCACFICVLLYMR